MNPEHSHSNHPKLHTTIGFTRRSDAAPPVDLETFLDLTARAEVDGHRFDGIDLALHHSYLPANAPDLQIKRLAANVRGRGLVIGALIAPSLAVGAGKDAWLANIRETCRIGRRLRSLGARPYGVIRIDVGYSAAAWTEDPFSAQRHGVEDLRAACAVADEFDERLAIGGVNRQGEIQDWRSVLDLLVRVNRTGTLGFHVDLAETLHQWQQIAPDRQGLLPEKRAERDSRMLDAATRELAEALRPWTISLNVGQTDGGPADHHVLLTDSSGRFQLVHHIGPWLHGVDGGLTKGLQHLTWDAGPFPAVILLKQKTWDDALAAMLAIREAHGWKETRARRHIDPAQIILLARKAARASSTKPLGPVRGRQTTLTVASKSRPSPQKKNGAHKRADSRKRSRLRAAARQRAQVKDRAGRAKQLSPVQAAHRKPDAERRQARRARLRRTRS